MRDDFNSVVADRFTVLDDVPVPDTWSSIQAKVLGPTPTASVDVTPIALEAPTPKAAHRNGYKRLAAACLLAAAAVLAIALVAIRTDNPVNPADQASPTVSRGCVSPRCLQCPRPCRRKRCSAHPARSSNRGHTSSTRSTGPRQRGS